MSCGNQNLISEQEQLPGELPITIYQAATFNLTLTYLDGNGNPVDLTDYTGDMIIANGSTTVLELSTSNGRMILGGTAGTVQLLVDASDTAALTPASNLQYDLLLTSQGGTVIPLVAGAAYIRASVTGA
ncbi:hypothetical protein [Fimbriiglobus ruber]|uniref:Uncharacterized protein n=1 Tax=Fimbriiglobus ruber TaxID=1908690 RepID=A0A225E062_9BACT|nr:hypothetical protein [Fimbriiglobus ruber]OWK46613.1 hypothetical protein FRUB_00312 [Fimbriiglobus ruber]